MPAYTTDQEGFLANLDEWDTSVAESIARKEKIELTGDHWEIITLARQFYREYQHSPEMRPLIKYIKQQLSETKASSLYLLKLFPNSPAKLVSKIAGLPRPTNCL